MPLVTETNRKWWVLAAMTAALSIVFVDQSSVSVALPSIQRDLALSNTMQQWVVNAYLLAIAAFIIFGGRLGDLYGHRHIFLFGMSIFIISSLTCALANSGMGLVISRSVQGIGGSLMIPATGVIIISAFEEHERGKATGLYIAIASVFLSMGPLLGGYLTQVFSWHFVFWINLPISFISVVLTLISVKKSKIHVENKKLDFFGFLSSGTALVCLVLAFMESANYGFTSLIILSLFIASILFTLLFIYIESKVEQPLVDIDLFKNLVFSRSAGILLLMQSVFIVIVFWVIYIQNILGYSPAMGGLLTLPTSIPILFMAPFAGHLRDTYGPRLPAKLGAFAIAVSVFWVGLIAGQYNYWLLFPALLIFGCAAPFVISSAMTTALSSVDVHLSGMAAGVANAARQLGSSIGLAIMGSIITNVNIVKMQDFLSTSGGNFSKIDYHNLVGLLAGSHGSRQEIDILTQNQQQELIEFARQSYTTGFSYAMYVIFAIAMIGFYLACKMPKKEK